MATPAADDGRHRPLRLGLVGGGRRGGEYLAALGSRNDMALGRLATGNGHGDGLAPHGCVVTGDWRDVVAADDLDGVIVATPPALHADMVRAAVEAGLPVLVEAPLATTVDAAAALTALAEDRDAVVLVVHSDLFHPAYRALKSQALGMGSLHALRTAGGGWGPFGPDAAPLWHRGPRDVAMCLDLTGDRPETVEAWRKEARDVPDGHGEVLGLRLTFPDGLVADIEVGNLVPHAKRFLAANYARHVMTYDPTDAEALVLAVRLDSPRCITMEEPARALAAADEDTVAAILREFADAVRGGPRPLRSLRLGADVVRVLADAESTLARAAAG